VETRLKIAILQCPYPNSNIVGDYFPMESNMAQNPAEGIAAAIAATLAVTNCLVRFLDNRGVLQRAEFIAYLDQTAAHIEAEGMNEALLQVFRAHIESIRMDRIWTALN